MRHGRAKKRGLDLERVDRVKRGWGWVRAGFNKGQRRTLGRIEIIHGPGGAVGYFGY